MNAADLIAASVHRFANEFAETGRVPTGTNGPRAHRMSPLRNAAHWLFAMSTVSEWDGSPRLRKTADRLRDMLLAPEGRPAGATHQFRFPTQPGMDATCGVVGPAWAIEALVRAANVLDDERCLAVAEEIFFSHAFSQKFSLWHVCDPSGAQWSIDRTLDHQLWFAACASQIHFRRRQELEARVRAFVHALPLNMRLVDDGRITFLVREVRPRWRVLGSRVKAVVRGSAKNRPHVEAEHSAETVEAGYQAFSLYALAMLLEAHPDEPVLRSGAITDARAYVERPRYRELLEGNIFGYYYNPPGFEVPYALNVLGGVHGADLESLCAFWINEQVRRTFDQRTCSFERGAADPETLRSRIYESLRIPISVLERVPVDLPA